MSHVMRDLLRYDIRAAMFQYEKAKKLLTWLYSG